MPHDFAPFFADAAQYARIRAEAEFALSEISADIMALPTGARVLEIGCGTGYLLARLSLLRPDLSLSGLEPIGSGFASFEPTLDRIAAEFPSVSIHRVPIEEFQPGPGAMKFDYVFSLNVFEHLADWRKAVQQVAHLLAPKGKMLVLCPNYRVPYEPHFGIPVIGSPALTYRLFRNRIAHVEHVNNADGLWRSINFISVPALRRQCRELNLMAHFERGMLAKMLVRLTADPEFSARQARIAGFAQLFRKLGGVALVRAMPADLDPYMKAYIAHRAD